MTLADAGYLVLGFGVVFLEQVGFFRADNVGQQ